MTAERVIGRDGSLLVLDRQAPIVPVADGIDLPSARPAVGTPASPRKLTLQEALDGADIALDGHDETLADLLAHPAPVGIGDRVRFSRASADGWYTWRGFYWDADPAHAYQLVAKTAHNLLHSPWASADRANHLIRLLDVAKQRSVMEALSRREGIRLQGDEFDQKPYLLAVQNGIVDLRNGTFSTKARPQDYVTKRANVRWEPEATCPRFVAFLKEIMGGDDTKTLYLLSVLGYMLYGFQREQRFWLWIGRGQNGKGTLMRILDWLLGDYSYWPDASLYLVGKHDQDAGRARPELVNLIGRRFLPMSEPTGSGHFNDEMVKAHTGDDPVSARALYSGVMQQFRPTWTIMFAAQQAPRISDVGPSMRRRVRVLPFGEDFSGEREDRDLEAKLRAEGPGILRLLVNAAVRYNETGKLEPEPKDVSDASAAYIEANDALADFVAERCVEDAAAFTSSAAMWAAYEEWARQDPDRTMLARNEFGGLLGKRFVYDRKGKGRTRGYRGVRPASAAELADGQADTADRPSQSLPEKTLRGVRERVSAASALGEEGAE